MRRKLLLTGAGFTANFDAPLAAQMWSWIYGRTELQPHNRLLEKMRLDLDFERTYFEVTTGDYSDAEKRAMSQSVLGAFRDLDDVVRNCMRHRLVNTHALDNLLDFFKGQRGNRGYIFTLNQDLYLERWYANGERPLIPGLHISHQAVGAYGENPDTHCPQGNQRLAKRVSWASET